MRRSVPWLLIIHLGLTSWSRAATAQRVELDLSYGADPTQRLDLSVPAARGFPTVLFLHGGSLAGGDKADADYRDACAPFLPAGIACVNVNYRLAPAHPWPAQAEDAAAAVAWVRAQIASRGGDSSKLFLMGHSTGAMLAAVVGTDERYLARHGLTTRDLRGVISMGSIMWDVELEQAMARYGRGRVEEAFRRDPDNGVFGSLETYLDHWPIHYLRAGQPPFLFLIAEGEQLQPPILKTNRQFVEDARTLGNWAEYRVLSSRTHYSAIRKLSEPADPVFALVRDFVRQWSAAVAF